MGRYSNPAVVQVPLEVLLPAEIPWLVSVMALASGSWVLVPLAGVLARRCTSQGCWTSNSDTLAAGETAGKMGQGKQPCSESAPTWHHGHQGYMASWALGGPPGDTSVLYHPASAMFPPWALWPLEHRWRKPKAHRQVPYPCQSLETDQQSAQSLHLLESSSVERDWECWGTTG